MKKEHCFICKKEIEPEKYTSGYGIDNHNHKICYTCIGKLDHKKLLAMNIAEKTTLYHTYETTEIGSRIHYISNWPGSFKINATLHNIGRHNIAGKRYDLNFGLRDQENKLHYFHAVQYGDNTEIAHVKKIKVPNYLT